MDFSLIKQAMELKSKMGKLQKEMAKTILEVSSDDGSIQVSVNGQQRVLSIKISPSVIDPDNAKKLEKLILKTVTDALDKSQQMSAKRMKELTGGINIPGLT
jgi:DNA-binding YbaB/EbfC family protein